MRPDRLRRPPWAPRPVLPSAEEGRRHSGVDRNVQPGREGQVAGGEHDDGGRDVLRQHLAFEQRALGVEGAEFLLGDAVDSGPPGTPATGEDARTAHHPVWVDPVDPDAVLAEFRGEQPYL